MPTWTLIMMCSFSIRVKNCSRLDAGPTTTAPLHVYLTLVRTQARYFWCASSAPVSEAAVVGLDMSPSSASDGSGAAPSSTAMLWHRSWKQEARKLLCAAASWTLLCTAVGWKLLCTAASRKWLCTAASRKWLCTAASRKWLCTAASWKLLCTAANWKLLCRAARKSGCVQL